MARRRVLGAHQRRAPSTFRAIGDEFGRRLEMRLATAFLALVSLLTQGTALADGPLLTYKDGPVETPQAVQPSCSGTDLCQHGFIDTFLGIGFALNASQQLGISCAAPFAGAQITNVGFFSEFWITPGDLDIVIYDAASTEELSRTTVSIAGGSLVEYEFPVTPTTVTNACVMLCPLGDTDGVTGEDSTTFPYEDTWFSSTCFCSSVLSTHDLTIWACWEAAVPVEGSTWGTVKALYGDATR